MKVKRIDGSSGARAYELVQRRGDVPVEFNATGVYGSLKDRLTDNASILESVLLKSRARVNHQASICQLGTEEEQSLHVSRLAALRKSQEEHTLNSVTDEIRTLATNFHMDWPCFFDRASQDAKPEGGSTEEEEHSAVHPVDQSLQSSISCIPPPTPVDAEAVSPPEQSIGAHHHHHAADDTLQFHTTTTATTNTHLDCTVCHLGAEFTEGSEESETARYCKHMLPPRKSIEEFQAVREEMQKSMSIKFPAGLNFEFHGALNTTERPTVDQQPSPRVRRCTPDAVARRALLRSPYRGRDRRGPGTPAKDLSRALQFRSSASPERAAEVHAKENIFASVSLDAVLNNEANRQAGLNQLQQARAMACRERMEQQRVELEERRRQISMRSLSPRSRFTSKPPMFSSSPARRSLGAHAESTAPPPEEVRERRAEERPATAPKRTSFAEPVRSNNNWSRSKVDQALDMGKIMLQDANRHISMQAQHEARLRHAKEFKRLQHLAFENQKFDLSRPTMHAPRTKRSRSTGPIAGTTTRPAAKERPAKVSASVDRSMGDILMKESERQATLKELREMRAAAALEYTRKQDLLMAERHRASVLVQMQASNDKRAQPPPMFRSSLGAH